MRKIILTLMHNNYNGFNMSAGNCLIVNTVKLKSSLNIHVCISCIQYVKCFMQSRQQRWVYAHRKLSYWEHSEFKINIIYSTSMVWIFYAGKTTENRTQLPMCYTLSPTPGGRGPTFLWQFVWRTTYGL